ncbi:MAG: hypothetical protein Q8L06_08070, partial [Pseudohongiella sp.]|nr:hypothetical protein [Pseudohongiella sp.]
MTSILNRVCSAALISTVLIGASQGALAQDIHGIWRTELTEEGYLEVNIEACDANMLCGTILRARDPQGNEQPYEHT